MVVACCESSAKDFHPECHNERWGPIIGGDVQKAEVPAEPVVAQAGPYEFHVVKGQTYSWCTCGLSAKQPLCDGSHKGTGHKPLRMVADEDATLYLCGCKHTSTPPYCDGTHAKYAGRECARTS